MVPFGGIGMLVHLSINAFFYVRSFIYTDTYENEK